MNTRKIFCYIGIIVIALNLYFVPVKYLLVYEAPFIIKLIFLIIIIIICAIFLKLLYPKKLTELSKFKALFPKFNRKTINESSSSLEIPSISKTVNIVKYDIEEYENITKTVKYRKDAFSDEYVTYKTGEHLHNIKADYIKFDSKKDCEKAESDIKKIYGETEKIGFFKSKLECIILKYTSTNPETNINSELSKIIKTIRLTSKEQLYDKQDSIIGLIGLLLKFLLSENMYHLLFGMNDMYNFASDMYNFTSDIQFFPLILVISIILAIDILLYVNSLDDMENSKSDIYIILILILSIINGILFGGSLEIHCFIPPLGYILPGSCLIIPAILATLVHFIYYKRNLKEINDS